MLLNEEIYLLREALTHALITLQKVHGYAVMDKYTLDSVIESLELAEETLQRTDTYR